MKKYVALGAVMLFLAVIVGSAGSGTNWKSQLETNCKRELVNAHWTRDAILNHNHGLAYNRAQRLGRTIQACRSALRAMP